MPDRRDPTIGLPVALAAVFGDRKGTADKRHAAASRMIERTHRARHLGRVAALVALQDEYRAWLDRLPESLAGLCHVAGQRSGRGQG
jgi:hypothetical protein